MRQATHYGHCQICGRRQLLPAGVLSKHGYTTRWGFFSGTCPGAGYKPFEESIGQIQGAITRATDEAARLRARAAELRASTDPTGIPLHVYRPSKGRARGGYVWVVADITATEVTFPGGSYQKCAATYVPPGETEPVTKKLESYGRYTLDAEVSYLRGLAAADLERNAAQHEEYARWQQERIQGWAPSPLEAR